MAKQPQQSTITRRGFVRGAAIGAGAAVASTSAIQAAERPDGAVHLPTDATATVTATVVRADHSTRAPGRLRLGVRTSIFASDWTTNGRVFIVEDVDFAASPSEVRDRIEHEVQAKVATLLATKGIQTEPEQIAVRVFGGTG